MGDKREKKSEAKKEIDERNEPIGSLGRGKGGIAWRHAFDAADPASSN